MAKRLYEFKTGVVDFLMQQGATTATNATTGPYDWTFVSRDGTAGLTYTYSTGETTFTNVRNAFLTTYSGNQFLNNDQVKAIGYGWQKWIVPQNMEADITVRGACGGHSAQPSAVLNQSTGLYSGGIGFRGGRGAKIVGKVSLYKGEVLYILVGIRGWCQSVMNWGAHGGGSSCILRENVQGQYTFAPTNKKVDVLFVAGGGGGAYGNSDQGGTNQASVCGKDALFSNGTHTNGGIVTLFTNASHTVVSPILISGTSAPCQGPGLTGDTEILGDRSPQKTYSILSGLPPSTVSSRQSIRNDGTSVTRPTNGTWGGGGGSWTGGGGGGGYSGGNTSNIEGGYGGTSYMNPAYVTEIFRGYETDPLKNPYSIPGSVEISGGRDDSEWFLAEDTEGFKRWEESQHKWILLPNQVPPTSEDYEMYGVVNPINGFAGLIEGDVKFLCSSPYPSKALNINGYANKQLIKCNFEMSLIQVDVFKSWNLNNLHNSVTIKVAVSVDHGLTYKILASNIWTNIDINNRELFYTQGILITDLNTIPNVKWKELGATNLRFAFMVHQNANYNNPVLSSIDLVADLL